LANEEHLLGLLTFGIEVNLFDEKQMLVFRGNAAALGRHIMM
jgi:hypothetical protein